MKVFLDIATADPDKANALCQKYGYYQITSVPELAFTLQQLVRDEGESAFKEIMELHPEKDVIIELFQPKAAPVETVVVKEKECPCMLGADGSQSSAQSNLPQGITLQTNTMILLAALIVSVAIISMKK